MKDDRSTDRRVVDAVDEVGNPTVLATITVIAASCRWPTSAG